MSKAKDVICANLAISHYVETTLKVVQLATVQG